ncbi:MAG: cell division protein ZapA [Clostridia bacterium]|nr:cell division protein ZapA [Clostridia bacterium]
MEKNRVVLNIAGQEFRLSSENEAEYMQRLAAGINRRIKEIQKQYPDQSTSRCALLAMLDMADELNTLREEHTEVDRKIAELRSMRDADASPVQVPVKRPFERAGSKKPVGV